MKKFIIYLFSVLLVAFTSCDKTPQPQSPVEPETPVDPETPIDPEKPNEQQEPLILSAKMINPTSFAIDVKANGDFYYYINWNTPEEWRQWLDSEGNFDENLLIQSEIDYFEIMAGMYNADFETTLAALAYKGSQEVAFNKYIKPETKYRAFAFVVEADKTAHDFVYIEFETPAIVQCEGDVNVVFEDVALKRLNVNVQMGPEVTEYYKVISYASNIDIFLQNEGEQALMKQVFHDGKRHTESFSQEHIVDPGISYAVCIAGYQKGGGQFFKVFKHTAMERPLPSTPCDSELVNKLLGQWSGTQKMFNSVDGEYDCNFEAVIETNESDLIFIDYNRLALKLSGFAALNYYSYLDLLDAGYSDFMATKAFGPKIMIEIEPDGTMWADATVYQDSFYAWSGKGIIYLLGTDQRSISSTERFEVVLSSDGRTLTIRDPQKGYYPTHFYWEDNMWKTPIYGLSDIVLYKK